MKKFTSLYVGAYIIVTVFFWLWWMLNDNIYLMNNADVQEKSFRFIRTLSYELPIKGVIFAIIPLFFKITRSKWRNLLAIYTTLAILLLAGDWIFGLLGATLILDLLGVR